MGWDGGDLSQGYYDFYSHSRGLHKSSLNNAPPPSEGPLPQRTLFGKLLIHLLIFDIALPLLPRPAGERGGCYSGRNIHNRVPPRPDRPPGSYGGGGGGTCYPNCNRFPPLKHVSHTSTSGVAPLSMAFWCRRRSFVQGLVLQSAQMDIVSMISVPSLCFNAKVFT